MVAFFRPIIGGYLTERFGWRSTFWFVAIFIFCIWTLILFFLPETYRPDPSTATADVSTKKGKLRIPNPVGALKLLRFPNVLVAVIFLGIMLVILLPRTTMHVMVVVQQQRLTISKKVRCLLFTQHVICMDLCQSIQAGFWYSGFVLFAICRRWDFRRQYWWSSLGYCIQPQC